MQGLRRIEAVTGDEAGRAMTEGNALLAQITHAEQLSGQELEQAVAGLNQVWKRSVRSTV